MLGEQYDQMIKEQKELQMKQFVEDKEIINREAERVEKEMIERDIKEKQNFQNVNKACVKEWEMRLKAKEFLKKVKRNTVKQLNMIVQDGTMFRQNSRDVHRDHIN